MELTHKRLRVQVLPRAAATSEAKNEEELLLTDTLPEEDALPALNINLSGFEE